MKCAAREVTHFRCASCKKIYPLYMLKNSPQTGWRKDKLVKVNNYHCICGSNDLTYINRNA